MLERKRISVAKARKKSKEKEIDMVDDENKLNFYKFANKKSEEVGENGFYLDYVSF